jgi:hypothetical protein
MRRRVMIQKTVFMRNYSRFSIIFLSTICKILLGDFHAKVRKEKIFKPTIGNESLYQNSNDNGVRKVNFEHQNILLLRA